MGETETGKDSLLLPWIKLILQISQGPLFFHSLYVPLLCFLSFLLLDFLKCEVANCNCYDSWVQAVDVIRVCRLGSGGQTEANFSLLKASILVLTAGCPRVHLSVLRSEKHGHEPR